MAKANVEGAAAVKPKAVAKPVSFADMVEAFKVEHPDEWEAIALTPTQHGIEVMAKALK